jgi:outer membrane murein-binding lipoprotein Lpp
MPLPLQSPPVALRSRVLPTVVSFKRELETTQQSLYMLQQEYQALTMASNTYQSQLVEWETYAEEQRQLASSREHALLEQVQHALTLAQQEAKKSQLLQSQFHEELVQLGEHLKKAEQDKVALEEQVITSNIAKADAMDQESKLRDDQMYHRQLQKDWDTERKILQDQLEEATNEYKQCQAELQQSQARADDVAREVIEKQSMLDASQLDRANLEKQLSSVRSDLQEIQAEKDELFKLCSHAQSEMKRIEQHGIETVKSTQAELDKCRSELKQQRQQSEHAARDLQERYKSAQLRIDMITTSGSEKENLFIEQIELLQTELKDLRIKMKEVKVEGARKLEQAREEDEQKQKSLREQNQSQSIEIDRLKAMQKEAVRKHQREVEEVSEQVKIKDRSIVSLQSKVESLHTSSNATKQELQAAKDEAKRLEHKLAEAEVSLANQVLSMEAATVGHKNAVSDLQHKLKDAIESNKKLAADKISLRREISLKRKNTQSIGCQTEGTQQNEMSIQTDSSPPTTPTNNTSSRNNNSTTTAAAATNDACMQTEPDMLDIPMHDSLYASGSSIADRLGRIRDAAERAQIESRFRREMSRLKQDHDEERQRLTLDYEEKLLKAADSADREIQCSLNEGMRKQKAEYESKLKELERKHIEELSKVSAMNIVIAMMKMLIFVELTPLSHICGCYRLARHCKSLCTKPKRC